MCNQKHNLSQNVITITENIVFLNDSYMSLHLLSKVDVRGKK